MKKNLFKLIALYISTISVFLAACSGGHICSFDLQQTEDKYLKLSASCQRQAEYYYSCECGKKGTDTFKAGKIKSHEYTQEIASEQYLKKTADCLSPAIYYKSCAMCGKKGSDTQFQYGTVKDCEFSEVVEDRYLCMEATTTQPEMYYKSCVCGKMSVETFTYGEPLKEYTEEEKISYTPVSLTVSLYDAENSIYGFTCNTDCAPRRPVLQLAKGDSLTDYKEYSVSVKEYTTYNKDDSLYTYYVIKTEVPLDANTSYTYRVYDKYVGTGTQIASLHTKDVNADTFSFVHVADTQEYPQEFGKVLKEVVNTADFLLHTGDVVETSKYEIEWKEMLHSNFEYLSRIPVMTISGNHETTYKNGSNEIAKHFNYKLPTQTSTKLGAFYSYKYGNVKFIMLNSNDLNNNKLKSEQYNWLVNELKNNTAKWTIVSIHNPLYSVGKYGANESLNQISLALRNQLHNIFVEYGVDIVLQGHDHAVSRTYPLYQDGVPQVEESQVLNGVEYSVNPKGVIYLMNGTAGGQTRLPYSVDNTLYKYAEGSNTSSWAHFEVSENEIKVSINYLASGNIYTYHTWGIKKA